MLSSILATAGMASRKWLAITCLLFVLVVGLGDYTSGDEMSFSAFYVVAVVIMAASWGKRAIPLTSLAAASVWVAADIASHGHYQHWGVPVWNLSVRFTVFTFIGFIVAELSSLLAQERTVARTDELTGLWNGRAFYELADVERRRLRRTRRPLTAAYLDVDNFKKVNDIFGHLRGDLLLESIGSTIRDSLRETDVAGRLGGDEFVVLLPETDRSGGQVVLEQLMASLSQRVADLGLPVGFSIGAETFVTPLSSVDSMISVIDMAMFEVKRGGRNGICWASPTTRPVELRAEAEVRQVVSEHFAEEIGHGKERNFGARTNEK